MDLKVFYQKVRQVEAEVTEAYPVVVSLETPEGGRAGVATEVSRAIAARLVVEGKARLASAEESAEHRAKTAEAKRAADQIAAAGRVQLTVVSESELRALKAGLRPVRG